MQLLPIQAVAGQIKPGSPLPWSVRDATGKLLLARGAVVANAQMVQTLLDRGMFVDAVEVRASGGSREVPTAPKANFFSRWRLVQGRLNTLLLTPPTDLVQAIEEVVGLLVSLADRYPDKLLFQILRHDQTRLQSYGVSHSLHTAAVCGLTAKRLGWDESARRSLVSASLTMNLSMAELQGKLAVQSMAPTPAQRADIDSHPTRSAQMLRERGVVDPVWLLTVEQHHETADGKGYPAGATEICEAAQMLHVVDVFTAKISARASRPAVPPNQAARDIFTQNQGHPLAAALIKEFGIYPPGCFVKLLSGETAVVVKRGQNVNAPHVACLTNRNGDALAQPITRDTSNADHSVISITPEANVMVRVPWETLFDDD